MKEIKSSAMVEIKINLSVRDDLGRPTTSPVENKNGFMRFLEK
jgi:phosphonopyruvate decarboxylase